MSLNIFMDKTRLSGSTTVNQYRIYEKAGEWGKIADFIIERFEERYFTPTLQVPFKHGFTMMAIACLVIETLESFYQGFGDTASHSKEMFVKFFKRTPWLNGLDAENFYKDIRCGILHQGESRNGWRIRRKGDLFDTKEKIINADMFLRNLRKSVRVFSEEIKKDGLARKNFLKKMDCICGNCASKN